MGAACRLGLTGGIGSGKSTVAQLLCDLGAAVIDADALAHQVTAAGGAAMAPIAAEFGAQFVGSDGALDRARMREQVFADASAKRRLEAIVHPLVQQLCEQQTQQAQRERARCIVFDIPLLVESARWRQVLDRVLVVDCLSATQVARVQARSGLQRAAVEKIMATQSSRVQRLRAADAVIFNDGLSMDELRRKVALYAHHFGL